MKHLKRESKKNILIKETVIFYVLKCYFCLYVFNLLNIICCIRAISPFRAVNSFHRGYIKTNQLMMYKAKVDVCYQILTKHSTQSEHHVEFLNVKPDVAWGGVVV